MTTTANDNDPRVIQAYRDLPAEETPPALDDKVLAMAAAAARSRYGLARAWMRPVAWAAMIGLCLAIVVEVAEFAGEAPPPADFDAGRIANEPAITDNTPRPLRVGTPPPAVLESDSVAEEFAANQETAPACDEQRASPESWFECAESLRETGLEEAADRELEALRIAFPDFPTTGSRVSK